MKHIRQASRQDFDQINALRITEFQRSGQFTLMKPEKLRWSKCDDTAIVLAAWDGAHAVATMRGVVVYNPPQAENCVECIVPNNVPLPAMVFNAAATHLDYRGQGLNQLLRYHFLKIAIGGKIQSLLSPMYEGAPRIGFMEKLGYRFNTPKMSWQNKLNPKTTRILGVLSRDKMPGAIGIIEAQRSEIIQSYPWAGKTVRLDEAVHKRAAR